VWDSEPEPVHDPGVDVIVVNYRTPDDLVAFIHSFAAVQFEVPATLFVVNVEPTQADEDAANDALEDIVVPVGYAVCPNNIGYAKACNSAAAAITSYHRPRRTLAFFNADTRLMPGVLDHCHWTLWQNEEYGIVGPKQVNEVDEITHAGIFGTNTRPSLRGWKEKDKGQFDEIRDDAVSVSGSAYFIKRTVWDELLECPVFKEIAPEALGAFLPTPHYYEETWCSYHAREHGWKVVYDGDVSMIHRWHQASPVGGLAEKKHMPQSRVMFRDACDRHGIERD
jgi:GT2 family glycosyltransferase